MSRRAILIDAGGNPGEKGYLEGTAADVANYARYLETVIGGAWNSNEIDILTNPTLTEVQTAVSNARGFDFSLVTASGHGRHVFGRNIDETRFKLHDGNEIAASGLNTGSDRCSVILDCCRNITLLTTLMESVAMTLNMRKAAQVTDRAAHRYVFERAMGMAEKGCHYLYSCNLNEGAQENKEGGYYSQELIIAATNWYQNASQSTYMDYSDVHAIASARVTAREPQQHPQSQPGRRQNYFPFAVRA